MTPQQLAETKRLAGDCLDENQPWFKESELTNHIHEDAQFISAANPEAILKLIESYEKLVKCVEFYGNWKNWEWDHAGNYAELTTIKNDACEMEYAENDGDVFYSRVGGKLARETLKEVGHE
jgi:hypothetical protein